MRNKNWNWQSFDFDWPGSFLGILSLSMKNIERTAFLRTFWSLTLYSCSFDEQARLNEQRSDRDRFQIFLRSIPGIDKLVMSFYRVFISTLIDDSACISINEHRAEHHTYRSRKSELLSSKMYLTRSEYDRGVNTFSPEGR